MSFSLPELPGGWTFSPLEKCVQNGSISYGVVQPGVAVTNGVPIIRVNNFHGTRIDLSDVMRITPEIESKYSRTRLAGGEVLLTLVGSVGQVAVVPKAMAGFNVARAVAVIHPLEHIDPEWIALCLRSPLSQHLLGSRANTTVQVTINLKDVRALPIPVPPENERRQITEIFVALDDRIVLLCDTNSNLEAIAQALFKSWFVDFDPIRAKQEGREPEGMDAATAALFPDSFEESELGLVPRGWRVGQLNEFCRIASGKRPAERSDSATLTTNIPLYGGAGIMGFTAESLFDDAKILTGRVGTLGKMHIAHPPFWASDNVLVLSPLENRNFLFCFHWLRGIDVHALNRGSTQPLLTQRDLGNQQGILPSEATLDIFADALEPVYKKIRANHSHVQTLATLRDTLLPRLISGQLRLPEAERIAGEFME